MGEGATDRADLDEPRSAAAAAGPADEKLDTLIPAAGGSSVFFFDPKRPPRNPSFSFFFLSLSFLEKNPPFFSFSFARSTEEFVEPDSVR